MGSVLNKSPDPPDEPSQDYENADAGEDSQESTTLQNVLKPMAKTKSDNTSQVHNSPGDPNTAQVQFISRPQLHDEPDLSFGFSYTRRPAPTPGQFSSRPKPSKPITLSTGEGSDTPSASGHLDVSRNESNVLADALDAHPANKVPTSLPIPQEEHLTRDHEALQGLGSPNPTMILPPRKESKAGRQEGPAVGDGSGQFEEERIPRKKAPFSDYFPASRQPPHALARVLINSVGVQEYNEPPRIFNAPSAPRVLPHAVVTSDAAQTKNFPRLQPASPFQSQVYRPQTDQVYSELAEDDSNQRTLERCLVNQNTVPTSGQKPRISLQNDISVSMADPSHPLPQEVSPRPAMVNRPIHGRSPGTNTPSTRARAASVVSSNTKVKRRPVPTASSSSRFSKRGSSYEREETPSVRRRQRTPKNRTREQWDQKWSSTIGDIAGCFNDKFMNIAQDVYCHLQKIDELEQELRQQKDETTRHEKKARAKDAVARQLKEERNQLHLKIVDKEKEGQVLSAKFAKLEEKSSGYKKFLNSAIAEQQELYKTAKLKCEEAVSKMQAEESQRNILQERERKQSEATREHLKQLVKSTVAEIKNKELQCK